MNTTDAIAIPAAACLGRKIREKREAMAAALYGADAALNASKHAPSMDQEEGEWNMRPAKKLKYVQLSM